MIRENKRRPFPLLDWTGAPDYDGPQAPCISCGRVDTVPRGVEFDEFLCEACEEEQLEAEAWLNHMRQMVEGKE